MKKRLSWNAKSPISPTKVEARAHLSALALVAIFGLTGCGGGGSNGALFGGVGGVGGGGGEGGGGSFGSIIPPAGASTLPAVTKGPSGSAFWDVYRRPRADAKAGEIYWAQERTDAPEGSKGWNIIYVSEVSPGKMLYVSGEIYVPTTPSGQPRDVVLWNHETVGNPDACAPSRRNLKSTRGVARVPGIDKILANGRVVVMSDYPGLGLPGPTYYMAGEPNARASLDAVKAVRNFPDANASNNFVMYGWSQGGQTTLWADSISATYAPDLKPLGSALIAPAVRILDLTLNSMKDVSLAGYVISTLPGIRSSYPDLKYGDFLTVEGLEQFPSMADGCFDVWDTASTVVNPYQPNALVENSTWWNAMAKVDSFKPVKDIPVVIFQGSVDTTVPVPLTMRERTDLCKAGAAVDYRESAALDHESIVPVAAAAVPGWFEDRLKGAPAASNCPG